MKVVWEGSFFKWHSLAHVNRELAARLAKLKGVDAIAPDDRDRRNALVFPHGMELKKLAKKLKAPSLMVRHAYPPNFGAHNGPVVLMQPWEFFRAPKEWVDAVRHGLVDELWCNSNFTRNNYIRSGVPPELVHVLPLGYDESVFHPGQAPSPGEKDEEPEFKFLYLGGTIERKGIDVLMRAFLAEFRREEPVRLIVKDTGTKHVYIHLNQKDCILKVVEDPSAPRVTYLEEDPLRGRWRIWCDRATVSHSPIAAKGSASPFWRRWPADWRRSPPMADRQTTSCSIPAAGRSRAKESRLTQCQG